MYEDLVDNCKEFLTSTSTLRILFTETLGFPKKVIPQPKMDHLYKNSVKKSLTLKTQGIIKFNPPPLILSHKKST